MRNILVRVPNWIGDVVMSTAGLTVLKQIYPESCITVVAKNWVSDVLKYHPAVDEILSYNPRRFPGRIIDFIRFAKKIRSQKYDSGVLLQNNFESALLFFASGIPERTGRPTDSRGFLLTNKVNLTQNLLQGHQVYHYCYIIEKISGVRSENCNPEIYLSDLEREEASKYLDGLNVSGNVIPFSAGAAYGSAKCWPSDKVVQFTKEVSASLNATIVFLGGEAEREVNQKIISDSGTEAYSMAGEFSLLTQAAVIEKAGICISNDSGLMHVAAAIQGVTVIAIFGPTIPRETAPFGENHIVIHKPPECWPCKSRVCPVDHACMRDISVADLINTVESVLSSG